MTVLREVEGAPTTPWRVTGLLAPFVTTGMLTSGDVHVARRLGVIGGETDERVLLAAALAVSALRGGSVCVVLDDVDEPDLPWPSLDGWHTALRRSPLVADGPDGPADRPLRWVDGRVYLDRYWRDEQTVRRAITLAGPAAADLAALRSTAARLFPLPGDSAQRAALETAATSHLTVLTGGPGTGKTTTVARLVAALQSAAGPGLRVALAAPTGKAAARLQESVNAEVALLDEADRAAVGALHAMTIHRLLGWRRDSTTRFAHDQGHRLPHDVVIVDEASMVSLPLMARLVDALRPTARLVLVGDPDQLASVEAGAVLGDLVAALPRGVVRLTHAHRYGAALAELAEAIRTGDADATLRLLRAGDPHRSWVEPAEDRLGPSDVAALRTSLETTGVALTEAARAGDAAGALRALGTHRLLLAHREGPFGVAHWAATAEAWVAAATGAPTTGTWPLGRPLLVTENNRAVGLYNGDTGVVVADGAGVAVAFRDPDDPRLVRPHQLPAVQPVHAMTVHRGQGSQFARVTVLLPPQTSPLLTRELLYTAVTRAREHVHIIGTEAAIRTAVERPVRRASGLREPR
ncbi:exodeoxyribonuclease V subunit alpha [Cellulomonas sp. URHD0024]|uniref:exodeoxyribonuclease V subunit alpha n=1 Tax=Cellulomonas sp. URHD0024 TaxID=1302620 RepID=UPI000424D107|nr:exodeoxyribonuclease V subunit alpha [Cellulomonas sp. URHD0024]